MTVKSKSDAQRERLACPLDTNLRFWVFVLETRATRWRNNIDFMGWIRLRVREFVAAHKEATLDGHIIDHDRFDQFLGERVTDITAARIRLTQQYFDTMPSRRSQ